VGDEKGRGSAGKNKGMGWWEGNVFLQINAYFCFSIVSSSNFLSLYFWLHRRKENELVSTYVLLLQTFFLHVFFALSFLKSISSLNAGTSL